MRPLASSAERKRRRKLVARLFEAQQLHNLYDFQLAELVGVTPGAVSSWRRRVGCVTGTTAAKIAIALERLDRELDEKTDPRPRPRPRQHQAPATRDLARAFEQMLKAAPTDLITVEVLRRMEGVPR